MNEKKTKAEQREATMNKLAAVAKEMFIEYGYADAATEEIVQRAGVTRGALYHHFSSKEGLFRAVLEEVQKEVANRILLASQAAAPDSWAQLLAGCHAFLSASLDPGIQRILLIDAPAVLGWQLWREIDARQSGNLLEEILVILMEENRIKPLPVDALTHLLSGAMNEAALWIAQAQNPQRALSEAEATLETLLSSLRL